MLVLLAPCALLHAQFALETETARLRPQGEFKIGASVEGQTSAEGQEIAVPTAVEYGLTDYLELLVEPTVFAAILPKNGKDVTGFGDTELTLAFLALKEQEWFPALAVAGEVKFPTANERLIGTGEFDYAALLIASKRFGDLDLHFNFGYTVIGKPSGVSVKNTFEFALAGVYKLSADFDLMAEVIYTTSAHGSGSESAVEGGEPGTVASAELAGEELVGTAGVQYHVSPAWDLFATVSYDNSDAVGARLGFSFKF